MKYRKRDTVEAWQFNGNIDNAPDWVIDKVVEISQTYENGFPKKRVLRYTYGACVFSAEAGEYLRKDGFEIQCYPKNSFEQTFEPIQEG